MYERDVWQGSGRGLGAWQGGRMRADEGSGRHDVAGYLGPADEVALSLRAGE
jgi:hypothetical protein